MKNTATRSLESQLAEFRSRRFLATPIAGAIAWLAIGLCGVAFDSLFVKTMSIFVGTGMIFYLAMILARFTGEDLLGKNRERNVFDTHFLLAVAQAVAVYSIAIPFFLVDKSSLPLTVGILTGLMWIPFSALIGHWIGFFHAIARTTSVLVLWYVFPDLRFVIIPFTIVAIYAITITALELRFRAIQQSVTTSRQRQPNSVPELSR